MNATDFWGLAIVIGVVLISMVLHELMHGVVAYLLGDETAKEEGRLTLNPFKHLDPVISIILPVMLYLMGGPIFGGAKPVPINTRNLKKGAVGMALVGLAGPLTNFVLALTAFLVGHLTGWLYTGGMLEFFFVRMIGANLGFMVFNLLPIPPLDGSRVLYLVAPDGVRKLMEQMERSVGIILVFVLVMIFGTALAQLMNGAIVAIMKFFYLLVGIAI